MFDIYMHDLNSGVQKLRISYDTGSMHFLQILFKIFFFSCYQLQMQHLFVGITFKSTFLQMYTASI